MSACSDRGLTRPCAARCFSVLFLPLSALSETTIGYSPDDFESAQLFQSLFDTPWFRVNAVADVAGVEICGALKNVVALAAGFVDGLKYGSNTKVQTTREQRDEGAEDGDGRCGGGCGAEGRTGRRQLGRSQRRTSLISDALLHVFSALSLSLPLCLSLPSSPPHFPRRAGGRASHRHVRNA